MILKIGFMIIHNVGTHLGILRKKIFTLSHARDRWKAELREERDGVSMLMENAR